MTYQSSNVIDILKKSRQTNPLQDAQRGSYGERYALTGHFCVSLGVSLYLKVPKKSASPCSPKARLLWKQTPIPEPYLTYLSGSSLQVPLM